MPEKKDVFGSEDILNVLRGLYPASRYWTLHGGAAVVYHFGHRAVTEMDFFLEPSALQEDFATPTLKALEAFAPRDRLVKTEAGLRDPAPTANSVKIVFERVTFSFIKRPRNKGTQNRISLPLMLPVASKMDALGGKMQALHDRDALNDFGDIALALRRGFTIDFLVNALKAITITPIDLEKIFAKMIDLPLAISGQLSEEDARVLGEAGAQGRAALEAARKVQMRFPE